MRGSVLRLADPLGAEDGKKVVGQISHRRDPEAPLDERAGLHEDVATRHELILRREQLEPGRRCEGVETIVAVEQRVQSGRVDEGRHEPNTSAK